MDSFVLPIREVIQLVLVERIKGRVADQMVDVRVPPVMEEIVAFVEEEEEKLAPQERWQQRAVEHAPVPQILEETLEVKLAPHEQVQQRTAEQIVEVLIPHISIVRVVETCRRLS